MEKTQKNTLESLVLNVVSLDDSRKAKQEKDIYARWIEFYKEQPHEELLSALVYEHENGFPLRSSPTALDRLRHKALVDMLDERAQTQFLKTVLNQIRKLD